MSCFFIKEPVVKPPCFILLGRNGDLIQMLPAFFEIYKRTAQRPIVITSNDYAGVLDGVSYVQAVVANWQWWEGIPNAKQLADEKFGGGTVLQWWHDGATFVDNPGGIILQSHGRSWGIDINNWPDYGTSMWERAGFTRTEMQTLPLVFDRRDFGRELELYNRVKGRSTKPILLVNLRGESSPFAAVPEVMGILDNWGSSLNIIDLSNIRAERIYDLLGLYDRAAGLITSDTSTLHLAAGSKTPYVAYIVGGWTSSVPKRNCKLQINYTEAAKQPELQKLAEFVRKIAQP
jgi:hypothetical protein